MSSAAPPRPPKAAPLPLPALLETLAVLAVTFTRDGEGLALRGASVLTADLRAAVCEHKPALLALSDIRARLALLHERIVFLRLHEPPKGTRAALRCLNQQADKLANMAQDAGLLIEDADGEPVGYVDDSDPVADDALTLLWHELNELREGIRTGRYPAPWPPSVDLADSITVFAAGRLLNGKFSA